MALPNTWPLISQLDNTHLKRISPTMIVLSLEYTQILVRMDFILLAKIEKSCMLIALETHPSFLKVMKIV